MLNRIFGSYLAKKGILSEQDMNEILTSKKGHRAKPEIICLLSRVLTIKQVEELLNKCNETGSDFKELVVEEGIMTDDRLESVLSFDKNSFAVVVSILIERGILDYNTLNEIVLEIQRDHKWNDAQLKAMATWDVPQIVDIFVPLRSLQLKALTKTLVENFRRLVDADFYLDKAYVTNHYDLRHYAAQEMLGDFKYTMYIEGEDDNLLGISNYFSGLKFEHVDEDVLDNVGEFINYINGQFASDMSYEDIDIDMASPVYSMEGKRLQNGRIYVIPVNANGYKFNAIYEILDL